MAPGFVDTQPPLSPAAAVPLSAKHQRRLRVHDPRLSVVIVNYCQWQKTAGLVRALLRSPCARRGEVEIVVVDNHSPPHALIRRLRRWPGVSLRRWGRSRWLGRAVNEGVLLERG